MSKSVTSFSRNGVSDWLVQRVSAVVLTLYLIIVVGWCLVCGGGFTHWQAFMLSLPMKIFSILAVLSLVSHAWIGLWAISTDYLKQACVRLAFQVASIMALLVYLIWALTIFWG